MFKDIIKAYNDFSLDMVSKDRRMVKDTVIGLWAVVPTDDLIKLFQETNLSKKKRFIDLGSGDGRAAIIAGEFTDAVGIEYDPELHSISKKIAKQLRSDAVLIKGDFMEHDLSEYDYLFIFPDKSFSKEFEDKLINEMGEEARFVVWGPLYKPKRLELEKSFDINGTYVNIYKKPAEIYK